MDFGIWMIILWGLGIFDEILAGKVKYTVKIGIVINKEDECGLVVKQTWEEMRFVIERDKGASYDMVTLDGGQKHTLDNLLEARRHFSRKRYAILIGCHDDVTQTIANKFKVPYIVLEPPGQGRRVIGFNNVYHISPHYEIHLQAASDILYEYRWSKLAIIYSDTIGLHLIGDMMTKYQVQACRLTRKSSDRSVDMDIQKCLLKLRQGEFANILVNADGGYLARILYQAMKLSMLSDRYSWVVMNLDSDSRNLSEEFGYTQVNLTGLSIVDENYTATLLNRGPKRLSYNKALSVDAINLVLESVAKIRETWRHRNLSVACRGSGCVQPVPKDDIARAIKYANMRGVTGRIHFDEDGYRNNVSMQVQGLTENGIKRIGTWRQNENIFERRLQMPAPNLTAYSDTENVLAKYRPIKVVTLLESPFVMLKKEHATLIGNDRYEGFLVDLLAEVAKKLGFTDYYEIYEVPDGKYGSKGKDGKWNGIIHQLEICNATMSFAATSITSEREEVIDFTKPYKDLTYSILMKRPKRKATMFQFLTPFSGALWALMGVAIVVVSVMIFLMDRFVPNNLVHHADHTRFNAQESTWFTYSSLVGIGPEVYPRTISGRVLAAIWWFFSLILISSYTANLAAFLTVSKIETPIKSVADLAVQTKIGYGTVQNTYCETFFRKSNIEYLTKMWTYMSEVAPDSRVKNSSEGINKVLTGSYAFMFDTPILQYATTQECDAMIVGEPFNKRGYGIGVPRGAQYRDAISKEILILQEEQIVKKLENKWWGNAKCEEFKSVIPAGTESLPIENISGIFFVLIGGIILAVIVCFFEFILARRKNKLHKNSKITSTKRHSSVTDASDETKNFINPVTNIPSQVILTNGNTDKQMDKESSI
ncbi:unnamed protein product [Owenia fusiformis]|uniref:Glutamate receptor n=1 Tax=Owenia fusiformis TaxID=6347 RepID=A0A8S4NA22_OWEFU|nr:unnamed protein product [Owenia fusiformis]